MFKKHYLELIEWMIFPVQLFNIIFYLGCNEVILQMIFHLSSNHFTFNYKGEMRADTYTTIQNIFLKEVTYSHEDLIRNTVKMYY